MKAVGLTIYCDSTGPLDSPLHKACPGYSTTRLQETVGEEGKTCGCPCHDKDDDEPR